MCFDSPLGVRISSSFCRLHGATSGLAAEARYRPRALASGLVLGGHAGLVNSDDLLQARRLSGRPAIPLVAGAMRRDVARARRPLAVWVVRRHPPLRSLQGPLTFSHDHRVSSKAFLEDVGHGASSAVGQRALVRATVAREPAWRFIWLGFGFAALVGAQAEASLPAWLRPRPGYAPRPCRQPCCSEPHLAIRTM